MAYNTYKNIDSVTSPIKDGNIFDGWYTKRTGGVKVTNTTSWVGDTLYAKWKPSITLDNENVSLTYEGQTSNSYVYEGDGVVSCTSSNEEHIKCSVNEGSNEIVVESVNSEAAMAVITVSASAGDLSSAADNQTFIATVNETTPEVSLAPKESSYTGSHVYANESVITPEVDATVSYKYYVDSDCHTMTSASVGSKEAGGAPIDAGTYYVKAFVDKTQKTNAASSSCVTHTIKPKNISISWSTNTEFAYTGKIQAPTPKASTGVTGEQIELSRSAQSSVGNHVSLATCKSITGGRKLCTNYSLKSTTKAYVINKAKQPMVVKVATKTVYYSKVKNAAQTVNPITVTNKIGTLSYAKQSGSSSKLTLNSTTGKITVKKGTYTAKIKVSCSGSSNYLSGSKTVTVTVKVK